MWTFTAATGTWKPSRVHWSFIYGTFVWEQENIELYFKIYECYTLKLLKSECMYLKSRHLFLTPMSVFPCRSLSEPLMTYGLHRDLMCAASKTCFVKYRAKIREFFFLCASVLLDLDQPNKYKVQSKPNKLPALNPRYKRGICTSTVCRLKIQQYKQFHYENH